MPRSRAPNQQNKKTQTHKPVTEQWFSDVSGSMRRPKRKTRLTWLILLLDPFSKFSLSTAGQAIDTMPQSLNQNASSNASERKKDDACAWAVSNVQPGAAACGAGNNYDAAGLQPKRNQRIRERERITHGNGPFQIFRPVPRPAGQTIITMQPTLHQRGARAS
jgi:hypothetical protein